MDAGRRGIALVSVVSILVLLMIVATPFLLSMRDSARRGENYVLGVRAEAEAEALFDRVKAHLVTGLEHIERRQLDAVGEGGGAQGAVRPPDNATPTSDTLSEIQLPKDVLRQFNQVSGREHRVWDVDVVDAQAKFNLNSCSVGILANLLGHAEVTENIQESDDRISLSDVSMFPADDGVVRIGNEVVRYKTADTKSNMLVGCDRGYMADKPENGPAAQHQKGEVVVHEAAFQLATRPFRATPGSWTRYTNVYEARAISDMGVSPLSADEFDRIRRFLTAWSGNVVGDGWSNPQMVRNNITAGDQTQLYAQIKNVRYFGPNTVVRITDGTNDDYAVVVSVDGTNKVVLAGDIRHDYLADQTRIYSHARAAVNVNTADAETLMYVFQGLGLRGKSAPISQAVAARLAQFLKTWVNKKDDNDKNPEVGTYRTWEDFVKALDEARDQQSILNQDDFEAVLRNAMNACDSNLSFSTVPFTFRSFDVYEARATAVMMGLQGQELARRELNRVFEVSSGRSSTYVLETQADFQDQIMVSRDAKWFVSYPVNVNAYYDGVNEPASEYWAFAQKSRFPDTDRAPGVGHVQSAAAAFRVGGRNDRYFHFDEQDIPDGIDIAQNALEFSVDGPYSVKDRKVDLRRFVQLPQQTEEIEIGLAPFACSFWYQPKWSPDSSEHVIFDYGANETAMNRVSLRYDPRDGGALVLGVCDGTREQRTCEIEYLLSTREITWEADRWYHIACTVYGCSPGMMELFVDAERVGRAPLTTRLRNQIQPTGDLHTVEVEDASGFPDSGVLVLRGTDGVELIEYTQRENTAFLVSHRKARNIDKVLDQTLEVPRTHVSGEVVELYGYSAPLLTDVKRGGATLASNLGPWRVFRAIGSETGAGIPGIGYVQGQQNDIFVTEWETGNPNDSTTLASLGGQGAEGIAVIVTPGVWIYDPDDDGDPDPLPFNGGVSGTNDGIIGGMDVVHYQVGSTDSQGLKVKLLDRGLTLRHWDASAWVKQAPNGGRYFPSYSYGDNNGPLLPTDDPATGQDLPYRGSMTAFIPVGLVAQGGSAEYLDPVDQEPQINAIPSNGGSRPASAYIQIDSEWIKYDTFDTFLVPGKVTFYKDADTDYNGVNGIPAIQSLFNVGTAGTAVTPIVTASVEQPGGSGQVGTNTEPPHAQDGNVESTAPPTPTTGGAPNNIQPPFSAWGTDKIAAALDFRSWEDRSTNKIHRIANTIAREHQSGAAIVPCFAVWGMDEFDGTAAGRGACPGFDDLVTFKDTRGSDEQVRVQWGYKPPIRTGRFTELVERAAWLAPTQPTLQNWHWDRPLESNDLGTYPTAARTRILKFPSREMPDGMLTANAEKIRFGRRFDDQGGTSAAIVDELTFAELQFPNPDRRDFAFLGPVPSIVYAAPGSASGSTTTTTAAAPIQFVGIDEKADKFNVFMNSYDANVHAYELQGLPIRSEVYRADGGMLRIDEELILYSTFDPSTGEFSGCRRGVWPSVAKSHDYGAVVLPVETFPCTRLESDADASTASFELADASDFAQAGYLRIDDGLEVVGYTEKQGNRLSGPLGRIDESQTPLPGNRNTEKKVGGALFRGRFATSPGGYGQGDVVMAMPFRHYDRYAERSDDPENSYCQFSWTKENAVWKRVTWDQQPVKNVQVIALVRFSAGPPWDSDRIIRVGQEQMPKDNRAGYLYEITDPAAENLLNVEADRVEVRLMVRFAAHAYDREMVPRPNEWKETPWIKRVLVEYVAPSSVMSQE